MKSTLLTIIIYLAFLQSSSFCQSSPTLENLNYLIGNWYGEGEGKPGEGSGYFSFSKDLNNNIIVRKSHSVYPAVKDKPEIIHDDLMIIYFDVVGNTTKAIYFDNEKHVINYSVSIPSEKEIVFTSDQITNMPIFRLTYSQILDDTVNVMFEISQDGKNFIRYVEGKSIRKN